MKIGIKNFRTFKDYAEFEIRPITILIGPNNSGKSSFTKFLLLLHQGWDNLLLGYEDKLHLGSFENSINWSSNSNEILLKISLGLSYTNENDYCELIYDNLGYLQQFSFFENAVLFQAVKNEKSIKNFDDLNNPIYDKLSHDVFNFKINIQKFLKFLEVKFTNYLQTKSNFFRFNFLEATDLDTLVNFVNQGEFSAEDSESIINFYCYQIICNELKNQSGEYLIFDILIDEENVTEKYKSKLIELQNKYFKEGINSNLEDFMTGVDIRSRINSSFDKLIYYTQIKCQEDLYNHLKLESVDNFKVIRNDLGTLLYDDVLPYLDNYSLNSLNFMEVFIDNVSSSISSFLFLQYLPANRGSQKRFYLKGSHEHKLCLYYKSHNHYKQLTGQDNIDKIFLSEIQKIIGIDGELKVEVFEDAVSSIYVIENGKKQNLADFGFGFSQLIPIILTFYLIDSTTEYIIVEEPEANLHPDFQSKIADIFVAVNKYKPWVKLIIETHSEYLIRKLQYLTAAKNLNPQNCIIHYFNADKNVSDTEPKVKPIEITEDGNLTDNFGPGFYDESTRLQFELMKVRKEQEN